MAGARDLLVFSAMGCGPYTPADEAALRFYLERENAAEGEKRSAFMVHLGDINSGADGRDGKTKEAHYKKIADLLSDGNEVPTFVLPGDNEWNDHKNPAVAWGWWSKHLLKLDQRWQVPWRVLRQERREENFAFLIEGVVVIGLNFVGGAVHDAAEWEGRLVDDLEWVSAMLDAATKRGSVRAAVVLCQANPSVLLPKAASKEIGRRFIDGIAERARAFGEPLLLLHADGHKWIENKGWQEVGNLTRVQLDRVEPRFPPAQVRVREQGGKVEFVFDRRLKDAAWKFKPAVEKLD